MFVKVNRDGNIASMDTFSERLLINVVSSTTALAALPYNRCINITGQMCIWACVGMSLVEAEMGIYAKVSRLP